MCVCVAHLTSRPKVDEKAVTGNIGFRVQEIQGLGFSQIHTNIYCLGFSSCKYRGWGLVPVAHTPVCGCNERVVNGNIGLLQKKHVSLF